MKKGILTFLVLVIMACCFAFSGETAYAADSDIVYIPDANFKAVLNNYLGVSDEGADITKRQMKKVEHIDIRKSYYNVTDLTGIEYCTNLGSLFIEGDEVLDLSRIRSLESLRILFIDDECIDDIKNITSCENLEHLKIRKGGDSYVPINFETIGNLKKLKTLGIEGINSNDYSYLSNLTSLERVEISVLDMNVLPDFSANENLYYMTLSHLYNISSLSKMKNVTFLELHSCSDIKDFSPMKGMSNLKYLDMEWTRITKENQASYMDTISALTGLEDLNASNCDLKDEHTSMFDNLTNLRILNLTDNRITNPDFLLKHKDTLTELVLSDNEISNNTVFEQLKHLEILGLNNTYVTDFTFIPKLPNLTHHEWLHSREPLTHSNVKLALPSYVTAYVIENDVIDDKGNYVAPVASELYSYDETTHLITIYPQKKDFVNYISYEFTMTTSQGEKLYLRHSKRVTFYDYISPSIVSQPKEVITFLEDDLTIDVDVQGNGKLEYRWYKNGSLVYKGTTPDLVIEDVDASDAGTYQLIVKDEYNRATTQNIIVTVKPYTKLSGMTAIDGNTSGLGMCVGKTITLSISAKGGSGNKKYTVVMKDVTTGASTTLLENSSSNTYQEKLTSTGTKQFITTIEDSDGNIAQTNIVTVRVYEKLAGAFSINGITEKLACEIGDTLDLIGSATGGDGNYMYQMSMVNVDTDVSTILKGYSSSNSCSFKPTSAGTFKFIVTVKDSCGNISRTNKTITVYEKVSGKLTVNGSTSALEKIQGSKITLTAVANGGSGTYTYQFKAYDEATGKWYMLQDYDKSTTYTYKLSYTGNKKFIVTIKDSVGNIFISNYLSVSVKAPLSGKLTVGGSTAALTVNQGTTITLKATGSGGIGAYTYKFAAYDETSGKWYILKDFSTSSTCSYTCNYSGKKQFAVTVKDSAGNTVATNRIYVTVNEKLSGKLTVNGSTNAITKTKGSKITLNVTAFGGTGNYTYKFAVYNEASGTWSVLKDFSTSSTYTYNLNYPGKKQIAVTVKDSSGKTVATNRITVTVTN